MLTSVEPVNLRPSNPEGDYAAIAFSAALLKLARRMSFGPSPSDLTPPKSQTSHATEIADSIDVCCSD